MNIKRIISGVISIIFVMLFDVIGETDILKSFAESSDFQKASQYAQVIMDNYDVINDYIFSRDGYGVSNISFMDIDFDNNLELLIKRTEAGTARATSCRIYDIVLDRLVLKYESDWAIDNFDDVYKDCDGNCFFIGHDSAGGFGGVVSTVKKFYYSDGEFKTESLFSDINWYFHDHENDHEYSYFQNGEEISVTEDEYNAKKYEYFNSLTDMSFLNARMTIYKDETPPSKQGLIDLYNSYKCHEYNNNYYLDLNENNLKNAIKFYYSIYPVLPLNLKDNDIVLEYETDEYFKFKIISGSSIITVYKSNGMAIMEKDNMSTVDFDICDFIDISDNYTGYGRINPKEDTYSFKNFKAIIPLDYYRKYLGNSCGFSLWERLQGGVTSNGVCAGMVTTAISTNAYDIPSLKASSINSYAGGCSYSCLYDVEDWVSKDEIMDAQAYWKTPYIQYQFNENVNKLDNFYNAVKNYCEGGEAVEIYISGNNVKNVHVAHALLALGIKENNSEYTSIAVYDCNYPYGFSNLLTGDRLLYLYKSNGVYTGWEYDFTNNIKWGSNYPNGIISYVTPGYGYANGIINAPNWVDKYNTLISVKTDTEINASNELVPIVDCNVCLDENGQVIANEYENDLYWVNGDNLSISSKNEPLDITISSYENRIVASVPENAEISINNDNDRINKVQISSDDNQNIELSYQIVNDDNEVIPINIIAESTDNLQASLNGNELQVISDGNVEVSGKENTINKQIEDESIVIDLSDDLSEVISQYKVGDTNKDGSFGISDLVRLQNWLLNPDVNNVTLGTSDLNNDGIIDAFDMVLLRKKFVDSFIVPEVKINNDLVNLYKGETSQIIAEVKPKDSIIKWSTSDSSVATVSSNGLITAKSVGSTKITATITYKGLTYSDSVNVNVLPVGISFDETEKNVYIGDKFYINNSVNPETEITWISNNPNVASVDNSGYVTANSVGSARIMGKINVSGRTYSATCRVTVKKINLNFDVSSKTVNVGEGFYLDKNASDNQRIIWTSSNPSVAYVNSRGYVIPISAGTSVVKGEITVFGYTYSDTCTIIVEK